MLRQRRNFLLHHSTKYDFIILFSQYKSNENISNKVKTRIQKLFNIKRLPSKCSEALILLNNFNYSMIEATRPEPTVLPPSRFEGLVILLFLLDFTRFYYFYYLLLLLFFEVLKIFRAKIEPLPIRLYNLRIQARSTEHSCCIELISTSGT